MNFQPELFPVGTVFRLNGDDPIFRRRDDGVGLIFTTKCVRRNGINSYVVETTTEQDRKFFPDGMNYRYHLSHIEAIIERGDGPLVIDYGFGAEEAERLYKDVYEEQNSWSRLSGQGVKSSRTHYQIFSIYTLVQHLKAKFLPDAHHCFDQERLINELMSQSFIKAIPSEKLSRFGTPIFTFHCAPKKRVDAWFKANINRFLINVKKAQKEYDQEMSRMMDMDMDAVDDGRDCNDDDDNGPDGPQNPKPQNDDGGSDYTEYDREEGFRRDEAARKDWDRVVAELDGPRHSTVRRVTRTTPGSDPDLFEPLEENPDAMMRESIPLPSDEKKDAVFSNAVIFAEDDEFVDEECGKPSALKFLTEKV